jgi:hypothetical protein
MQKAYGGIVKVDDGRVLDALADKVEFCIHDFAPARIGQCCMEFCNNEPQSAISV